jgi:hypothetical protein
MIRHGAGGHAKFFRSPGKRLDLNCAVEKTVIGVKMKVCKSLVRHNEINR